MLRAALRLSVLSGLSLAPLSALAVDYVGINGTSCDFSSVQDALDDPSAPGTIYIATGNYTDPGFVVERDLIAYRGDASCAPGGSGWANLSFNNTAQAEIEDGLRVTLYDIGLWNGVGVSGGNLLIGEDADVGFHNVNIVGGDATTGGGVAVGSGTHLEVYGGLWWLNGATGAGGALFADIDSEIELKSGLGNDLTMLANDASDGGAVWCYQCDLTIYSPYGYDVEFSSNDADDDGGAIYMDQGWLSLQDAVLWNNEATLGGAIFLDDSTVSDFSYLLFDQNSADSGGALYLSDITVFETDYVDYTDNSAVYLGGAVYGITTDFDADHGLYEGNSATSGGAVFLTASTGSFSPRIRHSTLRENEATGGTTGSAVDVRGAGNDFTISNSQAYGNLNVTAPGAALVAQTSATMTLKDITVADNQRWGVATLSSASATVSGSVIWGNAAGSVTGTGTASCSDLEGITPTGSNIDADPLFTDPSSGDYTLSGSGSPAWDACAAHAGTALNGVSRASGASDMGAYDH